MCNCKRTKPNAPRPEGDRGSQKTPNIQREKRARGTRVKKDVLPGNDVTAAETSESLLVQLHTNTWSSDVPD